MVADAPDWKFDLKVFHGEILNDHKRLQVEEQHYQELPVIRKLNPSVVQQNYSQIRQDVQDIIHSEMERILNDPELKHLVVNKRE